MLIELVPSIQIIYLTPQTENTLFQAIPRRKPVIILSRIEMWELSQTTQKALEQLTSGHGETGQTLH